MSDLLNEKQVAEQYNIAPGTLRRQRWAGIGFPSIVIGRANDSKHGGIIRYRISEIEEYLAKNRKL
jgi:protein-disulfide isomerase-like protein with CxxC motif